MADLSPAAAAKAALTAYAKSRCLREWTTVNDPPCHPSDEGWQPCHSCCNPQDLAAALGVVADRMKCVVPDFHVRKFLKGVEAAESFIKGIAAELEESNG